MLFWRILFFLLYHSKIKSEYLDLMKLFKFLSALTLIFLCVNCSKSETPSPNPDPDVGGGEEPIEPPAPPEPVSEVYFTFHIDESIDTDDNQDDWIVLHDNKGNLLDYKPFESTESLVFEKRSDSITSDFSVTLVKIQFLASDPCVGDVWHNIVTYPGIAKGSVWNYAKKPINSVSPEKIGEFNLEIAEIPGTNTSWIFDHTFLSIPRFEVFRNEATATPNPNGTTTLQNNGFSLYENTSYLMSIMDEGLNLKYKMFNSPNIDESLSFNYNEFEAYDSYLYLPALPPNTGNKIRLLGQNKDIANSYDKGFLLQELFNSNIQSPIPLGFLNQFDYYKTFFEIHFENYEYHYNRNGNKPEISIPEEPNTTIINSDISGFSFQTDLDYMRKTTNWVKRSSPQSCSYTWWQVHSTNENYPSGIGLPMVVLEQYPLLDLEGITLESTKFYINSDSYDKFIEKEFTISSEQPLRDDFIEEWINVFHNE